MKNQILILCLSLLMISSVSAYLPHEQNTELQFSFSDTLAGNCNVTTLDNPTETIVINQVMTNNANTFSATIDAGNFTEIGAYCFNIVCEDGYGSVCREVTGNGNDKPDGVLILGFTIILLFIFSFSTVYLIKSIGLIVENSLDILDVAYMWGAYFGLLGVNMLAKFYLGTPEVLEFLGVIVKFSAFPMVVVPVLGFMLSLFITKKKQKEKDDQW